MSDDELDDVKPVLEFFDELKLTPREQVFCVEMSQQILGLVIPCALIAGFDVDIHEKVLAVALKISQCQSQKDIVNKGRGSRRI